MMLSLTSQMVRAKTVAATAATGLLGTVSLGMLLITLSSSALMAADHIVEIKSFKFEPNTLIVQPGDTITWINRDIAPHTATANDKSWDTGRLKKGQQYKLVVTAEMSKDYFCRYHPHMKSRLEIRSDN